MVVLTVRGFDKNQTYGPFFEKLRGHCTGLGNLVLVVDVREMTNFTREARDAFHELLALERHVFKRVVYVGAAAAFVRLAADAVVIQAAGFAPQFVDDWDGVSVP